MTETTIINKWNNKLIEHGYDNFSIWYANRESYLIVGSLVFNIRPLCYEVRSNSDIVNNTEFRKWIRKHFDICSKEIDWIITPRPFLLELMPDEDFEKDVIDLVRNGDNND